MSELYHHVVIEDTLSASERRPFYSLQHPAWPLTCSWCNPCD